MRVRVAVAAVGLLVGLAAPADAAQRVFTFDSSPTPGVPLTTQYAADGVAFADGPGSLVGDTPEIIQTIPQYAWSGSRVLTDFTTCNSSTEFPRCTTDLWIRFTKNAQRGVRLRAGTLLNLTTPPTIRVQFYNISGTLIGDQQVTLSKRADDGIRQEIALRQDTFPCGGSDPCNPTASGPVAFARLYASEPEHGPRPLAIDSLTIWEPDPVSNPDPTQDDDPVFGIQRRLEDITFSEEVGVRRGDSVDVPIEVNRLGAVGALSFSATTPTGVTASFAPNPANGDVLMTLTAEDGSVPVDSAPTTVVATRPGADSDDQKTATLVVPTTVVAAYDAQITGMLVTQGVQPFKGPQVPGHSTHEASYGAGVELAAKGETVVLVYADALAAPDTGVPGSFVTLEGFRDGKPIAKLPVLVSESKGVPSRRPGLLAQQVADINGAFVFQLPASWTKAGNLTLKATVRGPSQSSTLGDVDPLQACGTKVCAENDAFTVKNVPFFSTVSQRIQVMDLRLKGAAAPFSAGALAQSLVPASKSGFKFVQTNLGWDVDGIISGCQALPAAQQRDCAEDQIAKLVKDWEKQREEDLEETATNDQLTATVGFYTGPIVAGVSFAKSHAAIVTTARPLGSVAHELFHLLGSAHTDTQCGGNSAGQVGADLSADGGFGHIEGLGLDRSAAPAFGMVTQGTGYVAGDYAQGDGTNPFGDAGFAGKLIDFMSYCPIGDARTLPGGDQWISPQLWNATLASLKGTSSRRRANAAANRPGLRVTGHVDELGHWAIDTIRPTARITETAGTDPSVHLRLSAAGGATVADVPMVVERTHRDGGPTPIPLTTFAAEVPMSAGTAARASAAGSPTVASVLANGVVKTASLRSPSAPKLKVLAPKRGTHVRGRGKVTIRWQASDADGSPLRFAVDQSLDGGRHWRAIGDVIDGGRSLTLPARRLAASRRSRIRVRANDGFNETTARSKVFRTDGAKPAPTILVPGAKAVLRSDQAVTLSGVAVDDTARPLKSGRLAWYAGKRRLGRGEDLDVLGLPTGRRVRLRLVATDRLGRRGTASRTVTVLGSPPRFTLLTPPARVTKRARSFYLRVAATVPATLTVTGAGLRRTKVAVTTRAKRVKVRLKRRSSKPLGLKLTLSAGKRTKVALTLPRG